MQRDFTAIAYALCHMRTRSRTGDHVDIDKIVNDVKQYFMINLISLTKILANSKVVALFKSTLNVRKKHIA